MNKIEMSFRKIKQSRLFAILTRFKLLQIIVPAAVIAIVYWQGRKEIRRIDWGSTLHYIRQIQPGQLALMLGASMIAVAVISGYDFIIRRHFRFSIGNWATFRYAWIANTANSVIGFAGIAGVGLRTILYRKAGIPLPKIAASIAYLSTITITGLSVMAWAGITGLLPIEPVLHAHPLIRWVVWADALFLPAFVLLQRTRLFSKWFNKDRGLMDWGTISVSIGISLLEWTLAGVTFWLIARQLLPGIPLSTALGIFSAAAITGLVSMAPGGIGGFDLTALLGLSLLGYDPGKSAAVLVLFRLLYYLVPFIIGLLMAAVEFTVLRAKSDTQESQELRNVLNPWQKIWHWPGQLRTLGEIGAWSLGKLVFVCGIVLLLTAATPRLLARFPIGEELLSAPLLQLSHQLSVIVGLVLIVLSWGIAHRVKRAYWWTLLLLAAGVLFTFTRTFDYEEAVFLLIVSVLLWVSRRQFSRMSAPFGRNNAASLGFITLIVTFLYFFVGSSTFPEFHSYTAVVGLAAVWLLIVMILLLRPARRVGAGITEFKAMDGRVSISYIRNRDQLIVLGAPIGEEALFADAMIQFQRFADQYSLAVVNDRHEPVDSPAL